jgi:hypothetical protein
MDPRQVLTEKAALEFLAELDLQIAPRLLAGDVAANLLVLQDLAISNSINRRVCGLLVHTQHPRRALPKRP